MKIGIIGAMDEEIIPIREFTQHLEETRRGARTFWHGTVFGHEVCITRCDPGKVNAAIAAQQMIDAFSVEAVFNMGSSGALSPELEVGDLVIATEAIQHDFDLTSWGMKPGELMFDVLTAEHGQLKFRSQQAFHTDVRLSNLALEVANTVELNGVGGHSPKIHHGRILSGDQFISQQAKADELWSVLQGLCTDMEAAAIAHTCTVNRVPFLCIRAISDKADHSAHISFTEFLRAATVNYGRIFELILERAGK